MIDSLLIGTVVGSKHILTSPDITRVNVSGTLPRTVGTRFAAPMLVGNTILKSAPRKIAKPFALCAKRLGKRATIA